MTALASAIVAKTSSFKRWSRRPLVGFEAQQRHGGLRQQPEIERQRPVVDVPNVLLDPPGHVLRLTRLAAQTDDLRGAGQTWLDVIAQSVVGDLPLVNLVMRDGVRPWTDKRHVAAQHIQYWHGACPSCRIYQTTFPTHARLANNSGWTNAANQTTDYPSAMRWKASTWFREGPLPDYVTTLDVTSAFCDPAHPGVWRTSDWTGALAQPISHGENHVAVTGTSPPTIGDDLVVEPGAPELEVENIYEVSGSGPWTVGLVAPSAKDHAADARVALAYTSDGSHPSSTLHKSGAAIIESYKANGTLP
jgi:hypothetical protein